MVKDSGNNLLEESIAEKVGSLYELMRCEKLKELEIQECDFYIHIKRRSSNHNVRPSNILQPLHNQAFEVANSKVTEAAESAVPAGIAIKSPITGVFYRAASPTSAPFSKEGDVVGISKTLCIVEAMKVMNEIKSENKLKIIKILIENGKIVNAGQDLFIVENM